ncbi:MAG: alpha/beta hydrolase [Gemmatimonadetes bacterium]|nr:alpha/beta hydrolase [Gemmatimonadota bacterium]
MRSWFLAALLVAAAPFGVRAQQPGAAPLKDIPYATSSPAQRLDLHLPPAGAAKPFPVIVQIHGGAFAGGDKADSQLRPVLAALARGYAVVAINYRLSGEARFPAQIQDVKAAIRWVRANAARLGLDPARIAVWGNSAGGHLAALAGTSGGVAALDDPGLGNADQPSSVQAVVDWYGPIDFLQMDPQYRASGLGRPDHSAATSPEGRLLGVARADARDRVAAANPETYISADDPPFQIQHGTRDPLVPTQQSEHLAAALRRVLPPERVTLQLLEGAGHGGPAFETPANLALVLDFLDRALRR